jgi:hypothetical protein
MPLFDKDPPPLRRSLRDRILYVIAAIAIWAAVLYCALT